jgi:hypothetical protein
MARYLLVLRVNTLLLEGLVKIVQLEKNVQTVKHKIALIMSGLWQDI